MSSTKTSSVMSRESRCRRSPRPVWVGVKTRCPWARSARRPAPAPAAVPCAVDEHVGLRCSRLCLRAKALRRRTQRARGCRRRRMRGRTIHSHLLGIPLGAAACHRRRKRRRAGVAWQPAGVENTAARGRGPIIPPHRAEAALVVLRPGALLPPTDRDGVRDARRRLSRKRPLEALLRAAGDRREPRLGRKGGRMRITDEPRRIAGLSVSEPPSLVVAAMDMAGKSNRTQSEKDNGQLRELQDHPDEQHACRDQGDQVRVQGRLELEG